MLVRKENRENICEGSETLEKDAELLESLSTKILKACSSCVHEQNGYIIQNLAEAMRALSKMNMKDFDESKYRIALYLFNKSIQNALDGTRNFRYELTRGKSYA